jgi:hypothetical protein
MNPHFRENKSKSVQVKLLERFFSNPKTKINLTQLIYVFVILSTYYSIKNDKLILKLHQKI